MSFTIRMVTEQEISSHNIKLSTILIIILLIGCGFIFGLHTYFSNIQNEFCSQVEVLERVDYNTCINNYEIVKDEMLRIKMRD